MIKNDTTLSEKKWQPAATLEKLEQTGWVSKKYIDTAKA